MTGRFRFVAFVAAVALVALIGALLWAERREAREAEIRAEAVRAEHEQTTESARDLTDRLDALGRD